MNSPRYTPVLIHPPEWPCSPGHEGPDDWDKGMGWDWVSKKTSKTIERKNISRIIKNHETSSDQMWLIHKTISKRCGSTWLVISTTKWSYHFIWKFGHTSFYGEKYEIVWVIVIVWDPISTIRGLLGCIFGRPRWIAPRGECATPQYRQRWSRSREVSVRLKRLLNAFDAWWHANNPLLRLLVEGYNMSTGGGKAHVAGSCGCKAGWFEMFPRLCKVDRGCVAAWQVGFRWLSRP